MKSVHGCCLPHLSEFVSSKFCRDSLKFVKKFITFRGEIESKVISGSTIL